MPTPDFDNDMQAFILGLKTIIRTNWDSQEEFAKGVTSKVNMSNILRGVGGTSFKMRQALPAKAGMTMEDVINIGKSKSKPIDSHVDKNTTTIYIIVVNQKMVKL